MTDTNKSESEFERMWKEYHSTFNEDGYFNHDIDVYKGVAKDFFTEQQSKIDKLKEERDELKAKCEKMDDFIRTCKYYLQDGEPVYQFSVEKLEALSNNQTKEE